MSGELALGFDPFDAEFQAKLEAAFLGTHTSGYSRWERR
jgi:hypothetical protein